MSENFTLHKFSPWDYSLGYIRVYSYNLGNFHPDILSYSYKKVCIKIILKLCMYVDSQTFSNKTLENYLKTVKQLVDSCYTLYVLCVDTLASLCIVIVFTASKPLIDTLSLWYLKQQGTSPTSRKSK